MATPGRTAADYMAETQAKIQGNLQKEQMDSLGNALGRVVSGQYTLRGERAKRGTKISEAIANYERALNSGSTAARIRASADMFRVQRELPVKFAAAAYAPNDALLNAVAASIPLGMKDTKPSDPQVAQVAWQTFFMDSRATDGNLLGSWRKMVQTYGVPTEAYYGASNPAVANAAKNFFDQKKVAEQNAKLFEENMNSLSAVGEPYEAFVERTGMPAESDDTVRAFLQAYPDLEAKLPKANAPFIDQLRGMVQDPEKNKAFFSDIDASLAAAGEQEEKYLGLMGIGEEGAATRERTRKEKIAAWIQRPDVQAWAKKWGMNLGTVQEISPEIQKLIDEGQISPDQLVNGKLYTPAPDDERAVRLAFRQIQRDPQKNIFYQMGLTRQAGPRTVMEIEEIVRPEGLKAVRGGLIVGENGKTARIVQLEDNSYAIGDAEGKKFTRLSVESGDQMVKNVQMVDFPEGASVPGLGPYTRTRRIQSLGPEYGRDMPGSERGIDLDTGKLVVIPPEKIASKEITHGGVAKKSLSEMLLEGRAAATRRKEGIDISTEAQNAMDIGKEATKGQIRESKKAYAEAAKAAAEEARTKAAERAPVVQPPPAAPPAGSEDSLLKKLFGGAPEPKTAAEREAAMQTQYSSVPKPEEKPAAGLPPVPASYMSEDLTRRERGPLSAEEIAAQDARSRASMAGVSPVEQVPVEAFKARRLAKTPEQRAAESATESAMFDAALAGKTAPAQDETAMFEKALGQSAAKAKTMPLPVVSPAPGRVTSGLPGKGPPQPPIGQVRPPTPVDTAQNARTREILDERPGLNTTPATEAEYAAAKEEAVRNPQRAAFKVKTRAEKEAEQRATEEAAARANAPQMQGQRSGRPPPVSPPLP